jgi:3-phenylpropionate/cinnamic acid dioxygenase small subunit
MNLHDRIAIDNLIARYARCVDAADYVALGQLFVSGEITANVRDDRLVGEEQVRRFYSTTNRTHADGTARTHHIVTNFEYGIVSEAKVRVDSCFTVLQSTEKLPLQPIVAGRYEDVFVRDTGGWRFASKHIVVTHLGNLAEHLTISLAD